MDETVESTEVTEPTKPRKWRTALIVVLVVLVGLLSVTGALTIGYSLGHAAGEEEALESIEELEATTEELTEDLVEATETLGGTTEWAKTCWGAAVLGFEALENRREALRLWEESIDMNKADFDKAMPKMDALDIEFRRLAGRVEVADEACAYQHDQNCSECAEERATTKNVMGPFSR